MNSSQTRFVLRFAVIVTVLGFCWVILAPGSGVVSYIKKRSELKKLEKATVDIRKQNSTLRDEIDKINNDVAFLEEVARNDCGLLKKNEIVLSFGDSNNNRRCKDRKDN